MTYSRLLPRLRPDCGLAQGRMARQVCHRISVRAYAVPAPVARSAPRREQGQGPL